MLLRKSQGRENTFALLYLLKTVICINGHMQFKPVLFKDQLYIYIYIYRRKWKMVGGNEYLCDSYFASNTFTRYFSHPNRPSKLEFAISVFMQRQRLDEFRSLPVIIC